MPNNKMYKIREIQHVKPGKGGAMIVMQMKSLDGSQKLEHRFNVDAKIPKVELIHYDGSFLYDNGNMLCFMFDHDFNQISVEKEFFPHYELFMNRDWDDGTYKIEVKITTTNRDEIVTIDFTKRVVCKVASAPEYMKGQTESAKDKTVILNNGLSVKTPQSINNGDLIAINPEDLSFVERVAKANI
jgi:elongation factor P